MRGVAAPLGAILLGLGLWLGLWADAASAQQSPWSAVRTPSFGPPHVIGSAANGCLAGGVALPLDGPGYQVVRVSRLRYYAHPDTVSFVERLGRAAAAANLPPFYVGDMSQPRGGPMPSGHAAHQSGVDVDIWFNLDHPLNLPAAAREDPLLPSMLLASNQYRIDPARFGPRQVTLLRLAARDPRVDRIFVNKAIKRALCQGFGGAGDPGWLHRIRPWWGHDDHFHVRLACPADSPDCLPQDPIPPGDGCDATLEEWFKAETMPRPPHPPVIHPPKVMPAECAAVLKAPAAATTVGYKP